MPKYEVKIVQTIRRYVTLEISADNWEKAEDKAYEMAMKPEDFDDEDITTEVEEVEEIEA